jgi:5'-3' exonuclease
VNPEESCESLRVTWQEANPTGVTIRVYAVTACLHVPSASMRSAACLVDGDAIPRGSLVLLGSVPASASSFSFVLGIGETTALGWLPGFGPNVDAVVLQAINAYGGSSFAIAGSSRSCYGCVL